MAAIDYQSAIRTLLVQTSTSLYTLCGTRVYASRFPESVEGQSGAALAYYISDATIGYDAEVYNCSVVFRCIGAQDSAGQRTEAAARTVARALYDTINGAAPVTVGTVRFLQIQAMTDGIAVWDEQYLCDAVTMQYRIQAI